MNKLANKFADSLFDSVIPEYIEIGIDSVLDNEIIQKIPIVNTVINASKFVQAIADRNFLRQTIKFIQEFNNNNISPKKLDKYRQKLYNHPSLMEKELGTVLIILNQNISEIKSTFLARCFCAYIDEQIPWDTFIEYNDIISRLFTSDIKNLRIAYENNGVTQQMSLSYRYYRLESLGLLTKTRMLSGNTIIVEDINKPENIIEVTEMGKNFCCVISLLDIPDL